MTDCMVCHGTGIAEYANEHSPVAIPRAQYRALMAAAQTLEQCVDDFGENGQCVCLAVKLEAINRLADLRTAGVDLENWE